MSNEVQFTRAGFEKLRAELDDLKGPQRMSVAEAIREAKSHGDLKENAAYHEAKLNQTRLESRIAELEKAIQLAKVVDIPAGSEGTAHLGSTVKLHDIEFDEEISVTLVGSFEADPAKDLISIGSPLGEALLLKKVGETISVSSPGGMNEYKIISIN